MKTRNLFDETKAAMLALDCVFVDNVNDGETHRNDDEIVFVRRGGNTVCLSTEGGKVTYINSRDSNRDIETKTLAFLALR